MGWPFTPILQRALAPWRWRYSFCTARYGVAIGDSFAQGVSSDFLQGSLAHNPGYSAVRVRVGDRSEFAIRPADRNRAVVYRRQGDQMVKGTVDLDFPIYPGDTVVILERWF